MQIKLEIPDQVNIKISDSRDNFLHLKNSIGKLTVYEMRRSGLTNQEIYALAAFHTELQGILSRL